MVLAFREILHYGNTTREVKQILSNKTVLVDGVRRKDHRFMIGLMDIISIPDLKESYRISLNKFRKLTLVKVDEKEAKEKLCKINGKGQYQGKTQLRLSDGRTVLVDKKEYQSRDSVIISVPDQKILNHFKFEKGALVLLTGGKGLGKTGTIEEIKGNTITIKSEKETIETKTDYCFVIGKNKPAVTLH